jgi:hypothetical protein
LDIRQHDLFGAKKASRTCCIYSGFPGAPLKPNLPEIAAPALLIFNAGYER